MTLLNPYAFTPFGQPATPTVSALRAIGAPANAAQLSAAQAVFSSFCTQTRLSAAPNQTAIGRLPDGTQYNIAVAGAMTTMTLWPAGASHPYHVGELMANGVLRGWGLVPGASQKDAKYKELKESGEGAYRDTKKLIYRAPPPAVLTYGPRFSWFFAADYTGLLGKFMQFVRGASAGYISYFMNKSLDLASVYVGDGMVVFGTGDERRVYFYKVDPQGAVEAIAAEVVPVKQIVADGKIPEEILSLFGGCPLPPTARDWGGGSRVLISTEELDGVVGFRRTSYSVGWTYNPLLGAQGGTSFSVPAVSTSDDGKEAYFVPGIYDPADEYKRFWVRATKIVFSEGREGDSYFVSASASAVAEKGVKSYIQRSSLDHPPETIGAVVAVAHFFGKPTFFETESVRYTYDNGQSVLVEMFLNIRGGINKRLRVHDMRDYGKRTSSGSFSASYAYTKVGQETTYEGNGDYYVESLWEAVLNVSAKHSANVVGTTRGVVTGSGGVIQISEASVAGGPVSEWDVTGTATGGVGRVLTYSYVKGWGGQSFDDLDPSVYEYNTTGTAVARAFHRPPPGYESYEWDISTDRPDSYNATHLTPGDGRVGDGYGVLGVIDAMLPQYMRWTSTGGTVTTNEIVVKYDGTTVYAGHTSYAIDALAVHEEFSGPAKHRDLMDGRALLVLDPLFAVTTSGFLQGGVSPTVSYLFSRLGAANVILRFGAYNYQLGKKDHRELNYGPLVTSSVDRTYPPIPTAFVGET